MKKRFRLVSLAISFCLLCLSLPTASGAGTPTEQIRDTVDRVIVVLKNPRLKEESKTQERRNQLREIISYRFDFAEMARRSLGSHWRRRTPEEKREFVRLFTDLLEHTYVNRIEAYTDQRFVYLKENQEKSYAEVESRVITGKGEEFSLNYKTRLVDGEWRVYDVVIENISLVNNYRSQFNRIINNSSYDDLIRRMKEKQFSNSDEKK